MANESRGSNAFGWLVLGFLAGVAATLAVLTFLSPSDVDRHTAAPLPAAPALAITPPAPATLPLVKPPKLATVHQAPEPQSQQQVDDDAAAAGMTSRRAPASSAPPPTN